MASTGFCGGLTTFSSFADGIVNLFDASQVAVGLLYIALNMLLGLLAVYLGLKVVLKTKFSDFANWSKITLILMGVIFLSLVLPLHYVKSIATIFLK